MIKSFDCADTLKVFNSSKLKRFVKIATVAKRKLDIIHCAHVLEDIKAFPDNDFQCLEEKDYYSIKVNDIYRIVFKYSNGVAENVKIVRVV